VRASVATAEGAGLGVLFDVLEELGVSDIWVLGNPIGDRYLFDPSPDMVIGVLNPRSEDINEEPSKGLSNLDVMLRIGRAAERGLPAIVIVPPPLAIPSPTEGVVFAACPVDHQSALSTHLWAFTTAFGSSKNRPPKEPDHAPPHVDSARILSELQRSGSISGWRFEELVSSVLSQVGAASVENERRYKPDRGVDIVVAPSDDSPGVILVETKYGQLDERRLRDAEQQLQGYVIDRQAGLGLVVYHDSRGRQFPQRRTVPLIVRLSFEELVRKLATRSLTQVLSDATASAIDRI
jgi:hypothetical protein